MTILEEIKNAWGWTGINPVEIVTENEFGNLILKDAEDKFWRLSPEEIYCDVIATSIADYNTLIQNEDFMDDWFMASMVAEAEKTLGELKIGQKYHMIIPGVLDGEYSAKNIKIAPLFKMIRFSGALGKQIKDLPDGSAVDFKVI